MDIEDIIPGWTDAHVTPEEIYISDGVMYRAPFVPTELLKKRERNDPMNSNDPAELEAAATRALALAAELRAIDAREPNGEEPTIFWVHRYNEDGPEYTHVAFKADNGRWYKSGRDADTTRGFSWRELNALPTSTRLREGDFYIVAEWTHADLVGGDE